jgi:hypothetical protein
MNELVFVTPDDGSHAASPDMSWLRDMVLYGGADFWCGGCGQGWLRHASGSDMTLAFADRYGFYLEYHDADTGYWIPLSETRSDRGVPVWVGGDPIIVSQQFFVSPDATWTAVEEFCKTGQRAGLVPWVRRSEVQWSFGYWDHPELELNG